MKKILILLTLLSTSSWCALEPITTYYISDSDATNHFFSAIFEVSLVAIPSKIGLQIILDYARGI